MTKSKTIFSAVGVLLLALFNGTFSASGQGLESAAGLRGAVVPTLENSVGRQDDDSPCKRFGREQVADSFEGALKAPERVRCFAPEATEAMQKTRHLPAGLGRLVNLEVLSLACLEKLQDLPEEIGNLTHLEELIIDNGNG